ncbi:MAG: hypothetical protein AAF393_00055 [Pseudomonadota bacterium]
MKKIAIVAAISGLLGTGVAAPAAAEVQNRRADCAAWEFVPGSEGLKTPSTALLFCGTGENTWLALRIDCQLDPVRMVVHYTPGFEFTPPAPKKPKSAPKLNAAQAAEREARAVLDAIPYEDSGIKIIDPENLGAGREMVFLDFQSFGYTGIAELKDGAWIFVEEQPLAPIFSRLITGNYADFKLLNAGITERFPLRGSGKALRPVVEECRIAKRDAELAGN